jgi:protein gp37
MAEETKIQWAHHTFNPWEGCVNVSPECDNCYAEARDRRMHGHENWGKDALRLFHVDSYWRSPLRWNREAEKSGERRRVFCGSLCDVMEWRDDLDVARAELYRLIEATPFLDWLFLTKRPQNYRRLLPPEWLLHARPNLWLGTTVGVNASLWRIDTLKAAPAVVHFLSIEPLLENLPTLGEHLDGISWAIFGGESGRRARPCDINWIRDGMGQCELTGTARFVKQLGARPKVTMGDGAPFFLDFKDSHAGDMAEWPEDLRVRELPFPARNTAPIA